MITDTRSILVLINKSAGGRSGVRLYEVLEELNHRDHLKFDLRPLGSDAPLEKSRIRNAGYSHVVLAGGDGTASSYLTEFADLPSLFHIFPLGTGNDLARELGITRPSFEQLPRYMEGLGDRRPRVISIWEAEWILRTGETQKRKFVNYFSLGWDAHVVAEFDRRRKAGHPLSGKFGPWGNRLLYFLSGFSTLGTMLPAARVESDGQRFELPRGYRSIVASNIKSIMGLGRLTRLADPGDDILELQPVARILGYSEMLFPYAMRSGRLESSVKRARKFVIEPLADEKIFIQVDGESLGAISFERLSFTYAGAVRVGVPE